VRTRTTMTHLIARGARSVRFQSPVFQARTLLWYQGGDLPYTARTTEEAGRGRIRGSAPTSIIQGHKDRNVLLKSCRRLDNTPSQPALLRSRRWGIIPAFLFGFVAGAARAVTPTESPVSLTQAPLVMRVSNDQFRVAFGINGDQCFPKGCRGSIRYRVIWSTEDGVIRSETRKVSYAVVPNSRRSITVDRQYFDTAEGEHTTKIVRVSVDVITCRQGAEPRPS